LDRVRFDKPGLIGATISLLKDNTGGQ